MEQVIELFSNKGNIIKLDYSNQHYSYLILCNENTRVIGSISIYELYNRLKDKLVFNKPIIEYEKDSYINIFNTMDPHLSAYILFTGKKNMILRLDDVDNKVIFSTEIMESELHKVLKMIKEICNED